MTADNVAEKVKVAGDKMLKFGLSTPSGGSFAVEAGADYIGFVFCAKASVKSGLDKLTRSWHKGVMRRTKSSVSLFHQVLRVENG